ncbi:hypothetical protein CXK97_05235 [Stutzerimonas stutzeri]|nr:hypothetical protein CXK97_05235 [Stutzerimonas stutzeri]
MLIGNSQLRFFSRLAPCLTFARDGQTHDLLRAAALDLALLKPNRKMLIGNSQLRFFGWASPSQLFARDARGQTHERGISEMAANSAFLSRLRLVWPSLATLGSLESS